jgi:hypothetical protein
VLSRDRSWPLLVGLSSLALLATHFLLPLNIDNDLYQAMGWNIARRGLLPYVGSWAHTMPGMPYVHALAIILFGNSALSFRLLDVLTHVGSALLMFGIARRFFNPVGAFLASTTLTLYYISEGFWLAGQPDGFAVFFLLLGSYLLLRSGVLASNEQRKLTFSIHSGALIALSGACVSLAGMIRPTYFSFSVAVFLILLISRRRPSSFVGGALIPVILILLPYVFVPHGLNEVYEAVIGFNLSVYGEVRAHYDLLNLVFHPLILLALAGVAFFVVDVVRRRSRISREHLLLALFAACGFISLYVMGKFLVYHFDPIFAVAALLCGYAADRLLAVTSRRWIGVTLLSVLLIIGFRKLYPMNLIHVLVDGLQSNGSLLEYSYDRIKDGADFGYATESRLVDYIDRRTNPGQMIELASITPAALWRSERPQASRFTMIHALVMHRQAQPYTDFELDCQKEYVKQLNDKPPALIIFSRKPSDLAMFGFEDPESSVRRIPGIEELLESRYVRDTAIGPFDSFRLR